MSWERGRQQGDWLGGCAMIRMSDALTRREARWMVKEVGCLKRAVGNRGDRAAEGADD